MLDALKAGCEDLHSREGLIRVDTSTLIPTSEPQGRGGYD
jgi:hypothetical protein